MFIGGIVIYHFFWDGVESCPRAFKRQDSQASYELSNNAFDQTAGSHTLAAAGQRDRYPC